MIRLIFVILLFLIQQDGRSQKEVENPSMKYSPAMQRLLIKMVGTHLYNIYQWQIDYDSSIVLACEGEGLSHSLFVNESFDDGSPLPGKELIDRNNISGAIQLPTSLRGEERIKLLLQLGGYFLFKPGSDKKDMLNAYNYLMEASALSDSLGIPKWTNGSRYLLGKYYYHAGDFKKSKTLLSEVVDACNKSRDTMALAKALAERGACELFSDTGKLNDITKALELFRKRDDKVGQIEMLSKASEIHFVHGLWTEAEKELLEAVDLESEIGYRHVHYYYSVLAFIQNARGNSNMALSYANKAISAMEEINDLAFSSLFYFRKGNIYGVFGDLDRSAYWYRKSMASANQTNTHRFWYSSFVSLSSDLAQADKYQETLDLIDSVTARFPPTNPKDKMYLALYRGLSFDGLKQASLADKNLAEATAIADQFSAQPQMSHEVYRIYAHTALVYSSWGDMKKAKECLQKSLAIKTGSLEIEIKVYLSLAQYKIDSSEGKWPSAIRNYQRYEQLKDSVFNLKRSRQIDEMTIQYNVQQKEKDLQLLQNREQLLQNREQLQKAELSRERLTRNIIIICSLTLLLLFSVVYNRYRTKRRNNELLQGQQIIIGQKNEALQRTIYEKDDLLKEKEWLVREIHHRVKNNLQLVISLLNEQSEYLNHPSALHAISESRERMQAIAILHQKLYQAEASAKINIRSYINDLVENIQQSFDKSERIHFQVDVVDIGLGMSQSVSLGLILNEAITNAIKYAYPKNAKGSIQISLQPIESQQRVERLQLIISDQGIGLPEGFDIEQNHSLGMQLIKLFTEQLEGELLFVNRNGLQIVLNFKPTEYSKASVDHVTGITI